MNILAVDTAGKTVGVALLQDDRLLYERYLDAGMTHSETLMPLIDNCLKLCGMGCKDIDLYGVNAGPGSFTGLRIGLAAVKGLAFPRETLCAPVSTLEALAAAHTGCGTVLCALDARRAQVYSAAFDLEPRFIGVSIHALRRVRRSIPLIPTVFMTIQSTYSKECD